MNGPATSLFRVAAMCGLLSLATTANAIERYRRIDLPHPGTDGRALGIFAGHYRDGEMVGRVACGFSYDRNGNLGGAAMWELLVSGDWKYSPLPGIGGRMAMAYDPVCGCDGRTYAVGEAQNAPGIMKPVLWSENPDGAYSPQTLRTLGGPAGRAASVMHYPQCNGTNSGDLSIVGTTQNLGGSLHATYWQPNGSGGFDPTDLGTLGGPNSEAATVCIDDSSSPNIIAVGRAQTASGAWHACEWRSSDGGQTWSIIDRHPGGVSSYFNNMGGGLLGIGGARLSDGRSMAGFCHMRDGVWTALTAPGFANSYAAGIQATQYGALSIGRAWDGSTMATPHAVVWNTIFDLGRTRVYPLGIMCPNSDQEQFNFTATAIDGGIIAGSCMDEEDFPFPSILIPDSTQLPDTITVSLGQPESGFNEIDVWHAGDDRSVRIRNGVGQRAAVVLSLFEDEDRDGDFEDPGEGRLMVRGRIFGSAGSSASIAVEVYEWDSQAWVQVVDRDSGGEFDILGPMSSAGHVRSETGEVRVRIHFRPTAGNVRGYEIDQVNLRRP